MSAHWTRSIVSAEAFTHAVKRHAGITHLPPDQSGWLMERFDDDWCVGACAQQLAANNLQFQPKRQ